jgi:hypothetical protein
MGALHQHYAVLLDDDCAYTYQGRIWVFAFH